MNTPENIIYFIGIDVSKYWFDFTVLTKVRKILSGQVENNPVGFKEFACALKKAEIPFTKRTLITMEDAGQYDDKLVDFLSKKKSLLCLEHALRIRQSMGMVRGKSDKLDAERIADYSIRHSDKIRLYHPQRLAVKRLAYLMGLRRLLVKIKKMLHNSLVGTCDTIDREYSLKVDFLASDACIGIDESIKQVEREMLKTINEDPELAVLFNLIKTVPFVGDIVAILLICYTDEFKKFKTGKQLSSYVGVVPFRYSSGVSIPGSGHASKATNWILRENLFMSALSSIRNSRELSEYYVRKVKEGKHKRLVLNNIMNKILLRVAAVVRRGRPYDEDYDYLGAIRSGRILR
jgi:transposase